MIWWIGFTVVCLVGLVVAVAVLLSTVDALFSRWYTRGHAEGRQWAINALKSASWWFSEDRLTMELLQNLADRNMEPAEARRRWVAGGGGMRR